MDHSVTAYLKRLPVPMLLEVRKLCLEDEFYADLLPLVEELLKKSQD